MAYIIEITKTERVVRKGGKEWKIVARDLADKEVYGYTPEIEREQEVEVRLLRQHVEELDLPAVIRAINKL